jgi:hypothetical protein
MIERNHTSQGTEVTYLPGMTKEQQIRVMIIPQLESLACYFWDAWEPDYTGCRKLDKIVEELTAILDEGDELK